MNTQRLGDLGDVGRLCQRSVYRGGLVSSGKHASATRYRGEPLPTGRKLKHMCRTFAISNRLLTISGNARLYSERLTRSI